VSGDHGGLSPAAHPPLVSDISRRPLRPGCPRHVGGRRVGDQVGSPTTAGITPSPTRTVIRPRWACQRPRKAPDTPAPAPWPSKVFGLVMRPSPRRRRARGRSRRRDGDRVLRKLPSAATAASSCSSSQSATSCAASASRWLPAGAPALRRCPVARLGLRTVRPGVPLQGGCFRSRGERREHSRDRAGEGAATPTAAGHVHLGRNASDAVPGEP
jgi:hypothetical protein